MSDIERDIESVIERLKARQSELAGQYGVITRVIETLEKSLNDLESLPVPSSEAGDSGMTGLIEDIVEVQNRQARDASNRSAHDAQPAGLTDAATYFNLSQSQAVIRLLRLKGTPMPMLEILEILKTANYPFKAKVPYQSLFSVMTREKTIVKRGKLWGLREWSDNPVSNGTPIVLPARRRRINFKELQEPSTAGKSGASDTTTD